MEELRSTEVLSREILEDARKKAYEILKTADDSLGIQTRDWDEKLIVALDAIGKSYAERTKKIEGEIFSRLPLDKRRLRSEIAESFLLKAMDDFLRSLTREKLLLILERELAQRLKALADYGDTVVLEAEVEYSQLSLCEVQDILKWVSSSIDLKIADCKIDDWKIKEDSIVRKFPSIVINTQIMKISASVEAAVFALFKGKRAELSAALLGEGVLND